MSAEPTEPPAKSRGIAGRPTGAPLPVPGHLLVPGRDLVAATRTGKVSTRVLGRVDGGVLIEFSEHTGIDHGVLELRIGTNEGAYWVVARVEPAGYARALVRAARTSRRAEDRSFPRLQLITVAEVLRVDAADPLDARTFDVSAEGVGLFGAPLEQGDEVEVRLQVPDIDVPIWVQSRAIVVRHGHRTSGQPVAGLRFATLDAVTHQRLLSVARRVGHA